MYPARTGNNMNRLKILEQLIGPPQEASKTNQPAPTENQPTRTLPAQSKKSVTERDGEYWKNKFFERFPDADTNRDGTLSWQEYKVHKNKIETENSDRNE